MYKTKNKKSMSPNYLSQAFRASKGYTLSFLSFFRWLFFFLWQLLGFFSLCLSVSLLFRSIPRYPQTRTSLLSEYCPCMVFFCCIWERMFYLNWNLTTLFSSNFSVVKFLTDSFIDFCNSAMPLKFSNFSIFWTFEFCLNCCKS